MGVALPQFKHGRYSMYANVLPARLAEDFEAALDAPDPLSLLEEISIAKGLLKDSLAAWERGASGQAYKEAKEHLGSLKGAISAEDKAEQWQAMKSLEEALSLAQAAHAAGERSMKAMDSLRKLVETSARVQDMRANSFTRAQALALNARLVELIAANIRDPQDRMRLLTALTQLGAETAPAHQLPAVERKKIG